MRVVIFGASGRTGRLLVEQALVQGHDVVAFARNPAGVQLEHPRLSLVQGDVLNGEAVSAAVAGADAVLSALGRRADSPPDLLTRAAAAIVAAMQQHGVRRLIILTGGGIRDAHDRRRAVYRVIGLFLRALAGSVLRDAEDYVSAVRASDLDWIVVRAPMLTDDPGTGHYRAAWVGDGTGPRLPRADVAAFMLEQLSDDRYLRQMPMVGV